VAKNVPILSAFFSWITPMIRQGEDIPKTQSYSKKFQCNQLKLSWWTGEPYFNFNHDSYPDPTNFQHGGLHMLAIPGKIYF
jgi:hypothetical protein